MAALNTTSSTASDNSTDEDDTHHQAPGFEIRPNLPLLGLAVLIVILNGTIVGLFVKKRSLRSFTNYFLVSLAISDLLTGLLTIPLHISCNATHRKDVCDTSIPFLVFSTLSTILHIAAITADRYIAILYSLRYQDLVTKKRVQLVTISIWFCSSLLTLIQLSWTVPSKEGPNDISSEDYRKKDLVYTFVFMALGVIPVPLMVFAYIRIFVQILRQNSLVREQSRLSGAEDERTTTRELRTVSMFVLMLVAYIFCLVPNAAFRLHVNLYGTLDRIPISVLVIMIYMRFLTSFLNPCFYGFGKHDFRCAIKELFKNCRQRHNNRENSFNVSLTRTTAM